MNPLGHLSQALSPAGLLLGGGFLARERVSQGAPPKVGGGLLELVEVAFQIPSRPAQPLARPEQDAAELAAMREAYPAQPSLPGIDRARIAYQTILLIAISALGLIGLPHVECLYALVLAAHAIPKTFEPRPKPFLSLLGIGDLSLRLRRRQRLALTALVRNHA